MKYISVIAIYALFFISMLGSWAYSMEIPILELVSSVTYRQSVPAHSILIDNLVAYVRDNPYSLLYLQREEQQAVLPHLSFHELLKIASFSKEHKLLIRNLYTHTITELDLSQFKGFTHLHLKLIHDLYPNLIDLIIHIESMDIKWYLDTIAKDLEEIIKHIFAYVPSLTIHKNKINPWGFLKINKSLSNS